MSLARVPARTAAKPVLLGRSRTSLRVQAVAAPAVEATPIDKFARNPVSPNQRRGFSFGGCEATRMHPLLR